MQTKELIAQIAERRKEEAERKADALRRAVALKEKEIERLKSEDVMAGMLDAHAGVLTRETLKVRDMSRPKIQETRDVSLRLEVERLRKAVADMSEALLRKEQDLSGVTGGLSAVTRAVESISIPETRIPEYPKEITANVDHSSLEGLLEGLTMAVKDIKASPTVNVPAPVVNVPEISLGTLERAMADVLGELRSEKRAPALEGWKIERDSDGNVLSVTESYSNGDVVYGGFRYDSITVSDGRSAS